MRPLLACLVAVLLGMLHGPARADDLEIYGGQTLSVPPNVLIILDNSSSMMCCLSDSCSFPTNCSTLANQRLYVAKNAIKGLVNRISGVNFGLMVFNSNSDGGRVVQWLGASKADLLAAVDSITTTRPSGANAASSLVEGGYTYTPLAETLVEAGLYFAGAESEFNKQATLNSGTVGRYTSPIASDKPCQKNYVIVVTDGAPTRDNAGYLSSRIGNYDGDDRDGNGVVNNADELEGYQRSNDTDQNAGTDYLDDVAKYLHDNDCRPDIGSGEFERQIIKTYTIGFTTTNDLLNDTAENGGTGSTLTANDTTQLDRRLNEILTAIQDANGIYTAPVIPRNPENRSDAGDRVYMALFKPQGNGRWIGNLKSYGLVNGVLMDAGTPPVQATGSDGNILNTARSYWSPAADGLKVDHGGAGALLAARPLTGSGVRSLFTYTGTQAALAHASNRFTSFSTNPQLTATLLGAATSTERDTIISETLAGVSVKRDDGITVANWRLGDIVHSEPLVKTFEATYQNGSIESGEATKNYIFVGANDGMLHVFDAADGREVWAFIPPGQLDRLKRRTSLYSGIEHNWFVDGSPVIETVKKADGTSMQLLIFGERRGGSRYYALDVTNPDQPVWTYQLTDGLLTGLDWDLNGIPDGAPAKLGQSWARPQFKRVRSGSQEREVFLLTGGYDPNQDLTTPAAADTVGRSIYTVLAETGAVFGLNINAGNWKDALNNPVPTHGIVDVTGFDRAGRGYLDRIYAGDLGGRILAARYSKCTDVNCTNDNWTKTVLFDLPPTLTLPSGTTITLGQKFMTRPEVTLEKGRECVYLGTGDREHPLETGVVNAIYAVCNPWSVSQPQPLTTDHLVDVTDNLAQQGSVAQQAAVEAALQAGYGWYLRLTNSGEKVVSTPKLLNRKLYFTTFTPGVPVNNPNPCTASYDYGTSRLYAVDYLTGEAVYNFNGDDQWTKEDRSIVIGTSIAAEPILTTSGEETSIYFGSGGKFEGMPVETSPILRRYFWRQLR